MSNTGFITAGTREYFKSYLVYDVDGQLEYQYDAPTEAANGAPCLRTQFVYSGGRIIKRKEVESTWNSSWDV